MPPRLSWPRPGPTKRERRVAAATGLTSQGWTVGRPQRHPCGFASLANTCEVAAKPSAVSGYRQGSKLAGSYASNGLLLRSVLFSRQLYRVIQKRGVMRTSISIIGPLFVVAALLASVSGQTSSPVGQYPTLRAVTVTVTLSAAVALASSS